MEFQDVCNDFPIFLTYAMPPWMNLTYATLLKKQSKNLKLLGKMKKIQFHLMRCEGFLSVLILFFGRNYTDMFFGVDIVTPIICGQYIINIM